MRNLITKFFILLSLIAACTSKFEEKRNVLSNPFFGLHATDSVKILAPNIISSDQFEYNGTFSPDGSEFYYTTLLPNRGQVVFLELKENIWSEPKFATFSSNYSEVDPIFSPDGSRLYFTSSRPISDSTDLLINRIWYVERIENGWGDPQVVTLTENGDLYSSITNNGDIYFNTGAGDILKAVKSDSSHLVEKLPDIINLNKSVSDPFISPEEDYLIFRGNNLEDRIGITDLYISFNINNEWTEPINLGEPINSSAREMSPFVTSNGAFLIFASTRLMKEFETKPGESISPFMEKSTSFDNGRWNIFYTSTTFIEKLRAKAEKAETSTNK
ncbi:hypothetical protein [Aquiflexum sp.]|uniref:TolB family protein n=1 Tax=Aquiflexum sp. TaxID=1872584 RepID=UPI00359471C8